MLWSKEHQIVYIKTAKTASSTAEIRLEYLLFGSSDDSRDAHIFTDGSIAGFRGKSFSRGSLNEKLRHHLPAKNIMEIIGSEEFNSASKVSSIRNPYDRAISAFHYFSRFSPQSAAELLREEGKSALATRFQQWLSDGVDGARYNAKEHFYVDNTLVIDHFIRAESLDDDIEALCNLKGIPDRQPSFKSLRSVRVNRSRERIPLKDYFTEVSLSHINQQYEAWFTVGQYEVFDNLAEFPDS